jgi:hypothetical protein
MRQNRSISALNVNHITHIWREINLTAYPRGPNISKFVSELIRNRLFRKKTQNLKFKIDKTNKENNIINEKNKG